MATERGGLDYLIQVRTRGLTELRAAAQQVRTLQQNLNSLGRSQGGLGNLSGQARRAARELGRLAAARDRLTSNAPRDILGAGSLAGLRQAVSDLGRARGEMAILARDLNRTVAAASRLGSGLNAAANSANRLRTNSANSARNFSQINSFTSGIGASLGFTAVYRGIQLAEDAVTGVVGGMVRFNQVTESANLGVAALITNFQGVRDANGNVLEGVEALNAAQKVAQRQIEKIRVDSLETAGTFEQLTQAFQVAVGPGLEAGLDLDQIRDFTVRVSQAASAIALPQNQLAEEIRSILGGGINPRNTRIAAVLGITDADVKNAKQAGRLVEFLNEKFKDFEVAGRQSLKTFAGLSSSLQSIFEFALGQGGEDFFNELKAFLGDGLRSISDTTGGVLTVSPEVIQGIRFVADALTTALDEGRRLARIFGSDLVGGAELFGNSLRTGIQFLSGFVEGLIRGMQAILTAARSVSEVFFRLTGIELFSEANLQDFGRSLGEIAVAAAAVGATMVAVRAPLLLVVAAVTALGSAAQTTLDEFTGASTGVITTARLIAAQVEGAFDSLVLGVEQVFVSVKNTVTQQGAAVAGALVDLFSFALDSVGEFLIKGIGDILATAVKLAVDQAAAPFRALLQGLAALGSDDAQAALDALDNAGNAAGGAIAKAAQSFVNANKVLAAGLSARIAEFEKANALAADVEQRELDARKRQSEVQQLRKQQGAITAARIGNEAQGFRRDDFDSFFKNLFGDQFDPIRQEQDPEFAAKAQKDAAEQFQNATDDFLDGVTFFNKDRKKEAEVAATSPATGAQGSLGGAVAPPTGPTLRDVFVNLRDDTASVGDALRSLGSSITNFFSDSPDKSRELGLNNLLTPDGSPSFFSIGPQAQQGQAADPTATAQQTTEAFNSANSQVSEFATSLNSAIQQLRTALAQPTADLGNLSTALRAAAQAALAFQLSAAARSARGGPTRGFASGGAVLGAHSVGYSPAGVASSDTVPAWLTPGEFVQRVRAVRTYGRPFMEALNRGLIDPRVINGLVGARRRVGRTPLPRSGYATGGSVAANPATQAAAVRAFLVADESLQEALFEGSAFTRSLYSNQETIRGFL